jgi:hypothetical protein
MYIMKGQGCIEIHNIAGWPATVLSLGFSRFDEFSFLDVDPKL